MVYECEKCNSPLSAGVMACSKCGERFDEAVPQDAEVPARGWQPKSEVIISSSTDLQPEISTPTTPKIANFREQHPASPHLSELIPSTKSQQSRPTPDYQSSATISKPKSAKTPIWVYIVAFIFLPITLIYLICLAIVKIWKQPSWSVKTKAFLTVLVVAAVILPAMFSKYSDGSNQGNGQPGMASPTVVANLKPEDARQASDGQPLTDIGAVGHLQIPGADATDPAIHVGASEQGLSDLTDTSLKKDDVGFQQVFDRGEAFTVSAGTQAKLLDFHGFLGSVAHVRIIGGTHDTEEAWVPSEWIRKN